jgi:hypothetical protein
MTVSAQKVVSNKELEITKPGIGPDSIMYGLDRAMERISLALTFNKVKKAKKALKNAEERLAEVEDMIEKNESEEADIAQENYDEAINETEELIDEIESNEDVNTTEEALKEVMGLKMKVMSHGEKVAFVKDRILERMTASNMSEEKIAHLTEVFERIKTKALEVENKIEQKRNRVKTKYKVMAGKTDEEIEELESEIEEELEDEESEEEIEEENSEN